MVKQVFVAVSLATAILAGAFAGVNSGAHSGVTSRSEAAADVVQQHASTNPAAPNLTVPTLSEDRYTDGRWYGNVTPRQLPPTSGQCGDGIPCR